MWNELQDPYTNIRYVAMNLKAILNNNDLKLEKNDDPQQYTSTFLAFARYNGTRLNSNTRAYAMAVERYYNAFKSIRG